MLGERRHVEALAPGFLGQFIRNVDVDPGHVHSIHTRFAGAGDGALGLVGGVWFVLEILCFPYRVERGKAIKEYSEQAENVRCDLKPCATRGQPPCAEVIVDLIGSTTTRSGLKVRAEALRTFA